VPPASFSPRPDSVGDAGATAATPAANTTIATLGDLPDGVYDVEVAAYQVATVDANRANAEVRNGNATISDLLTTAVETRARFPRVTMVNGNQLLVRTGAAAGGAGSVYVAQITANRVE